jgi:hypothetical protein
MATTIKEREATRQHLVALCQKLLAGRAPLVLARQMARVLCRIASDEQLQTVKEAQGVIAVFRSKGLIAEDFVQMCEPFFAAASSGATLSAEAFAVSFASAAYPNRVFQIPETKLTLRLQAFYEAFIQMQACAPGQEADWLLSIARLPDGFSPHQTNELLADLAAVACLTDDSKPQEIEDRIGGAMLYLTSCYAESVARMCDNWQSQAGLVRCIRGEFMSPPSVATNEARFAQELPQWSRIRSNLAALFPSTPAEYLNQALVLEQSPWKEARKQFRAAELEIAASYIAEKVHGFWALLSDKLASGFPYYAFGSRFVHWWKECALNFRFIPDQGEIRQIKATRQAGSNLAEEADRRLEELSARSEDPVEEFEITPRLLSSLREGYRLVRSTFFTPLKKAAQELGQANTSENELVRKALDELYYHRLEKIMDEEKTRLSVQEIASHFPALKPDAINTYNARLRARMRAYAFARLRRWSNNEIAFAMRTPVRRRAVGEFQAKEKNEPGLFTVASLARFVPHKETLLWAFIAHLFLRPRVDPQHADGWSFERLLRESWWWVTDDTFDKAVGLGVEKGNGADQAAWTAMEGPPFAEMIAQLRSIKAEEELDELLPRQDLLAGETQALKLIGQLTRDDEFLSVFDKSIPVWRKKAARHWVVPVWYLTFIERLKQDELLDVLVVDANDYPSVVALYKLMASCRINQPDKQAALVSEEPVKKTL